MNGAVYQNGVRSESARLFVSRSDRAPDKNWGVSMIDLSGGRPFLPAVTASGVDSRNPLADAGERASNGLASPTTARFASTPTGACSMSA